MKIAILYICTGTYTIFWKEFYKTAEKFFLIDLEKKYFVFTDSINLYGRNSGKVTVLNQKNLGWPYNTLMRYHMFNQIKNNIENYDYIYFFNANIKFVKPVGLEILPKDKNLVAVKYVRFFRKNKFSPYEKNPSSTAFVSHKNEKNPVRGGLNGGKSKEFLKMIHILKNNIQEDLEQGIIATWHDEAHICKYMINRNDVKYLDPGYLYPQGMVMPYECKILLRRKSNDLLRYGTENVKKEILFNIKLAIRNILYIICIKLGIIKYDEN